MPDLFQDVTRSQTQKQISQVEQTPDLRPGASDWLAPDVVQALEGARQGGLQKLYGNDWEAAGAKLDDAYRTQGPSAYERLEQSPEAYGAVTGDARYSEMVAGGLYARERVLAEARGETPAETYRNADAALSKGQHRQLPERLDVGDVTTFHSDRVLLVTAGGRTRGYGGAAVPVGPAVSPVTVSVGGFVSVDRVGRRGGVPSAEIRIAAYAQTSTNAAGRVDNVLTSGRLVDVTPGGGGRDIPFSLRPSHTKPSMPESPGGTRDLGTGTIIVPAGRIYRAEFGVATSTPSRSPYRHDPETYEGPTFTATGH